MKSITLEIRDRMTAIYVIATEMRSEDPIESKNLWKMGFTPSGDRFVFVCRVDPGSGNYDPFRWNSAARTMREAHKVIVRKWDELKSGDVVDVEYELGETASKKEPQ